MTTPEPSHFDIQDALLIAGFVLVVGGVAAFSWRSSIIVAGILCFAAVWTIERAKAAMKGKETNGTSN